LLQDESFPGIGKLFIKKQLESSEGEAKIVNLEPLQPHEHQLHNTKLFKQRQLESFQGVAKRVNLEPL